MILLLLLFLLRFQVAFKVGQNFVQSKYVKEKMAAEAESNNIFTVSLMKSLSAEKGSVENIFFSPWSVSSALGMVATGAKGKTLEEMATCFGWKTGSPSDLSPALARLALDVSQVGQSSSQNVLRLANKLWIDNGFKISDNFKTTLQKDYHAEVGIANLSARSEVARDEINNWVKEHTVHKIKDLFPQGTINAATCLVLANAVYFKGQWENKFDKNQTHDAEFHLHGGKTTSVQMMFMNDEFKAYRDMEHDCEILHMPYAGKRFSMLIILPDEVEGVSKIIQNLSSQLLSEWVTSSVPQEMDVHLPRFKISDRMNLKEKLEKIGIRNIFSDQADLSGITGEPNLYISSAMHKAFVEVNEEGTEAAAATGVGIALMSMPAQFMVDRPFLFLIRHNSTGAVVFIGKVTDPTKE